MCGIAGFVHRVGRDNAPLDVMLARLAHRGPDGSGKWQGTSGAWSANLGHRRLSIIDLAGGSQPMASVDGGAVIAFNGEVYNFRELRQPLEAAGHRFRTASDTEVLLRHLEQHGVAGIADLNGMFAFALWDSSSATLTLARDRIGIKPLYYAQLPEGGVAFASELTALLAYPTIERTVDLHGVTSLFFRDYAHAPASMIAGVCKLEPGHSVTWHTGQLSNPQPFWALNECVAPRAGRSNAMLVDELRQRLDTAVQSQLVADVPVGVFLSGGIDSSAVAALATRHVRGELHTFSIGFDDAEYDESVHARRVAEYIGSHHIEQRFTEHDLLEVMDDALSCLDEPMADPSIIPTYLLSRLAAKHVKVVLGGDGGDELWAGYPTYKAHRASAVYGAVPTYIRKQVIERVVAGMPVSHGYQRLDWKLKRFALRWRPEAIERHQHWMGGVDLNELKHAIPSSGSPWIESRAAGNDFLNRILAFDLRTYLPGSVLTKVDRASMAHGLEVRPPLLDNALVDFAFTLPSSVKLRNGTSKWLLKHAVATLLPADIIRRRKKGFGVPLSRWIRSSLRSRVERILSDSPVWSLPMLRREAFVRWNDDHQVGRHDFSRPLWTMIVFDQWLHGL